MTINTGSFDLNAIDNYFPKESYREGQKECIEYALNSFNDGKKVVILECPTGSGKSTIGMTVANMVKNSYYLTITKILQDQLVGDFGEAITELKGRGSYPCTYWDRFGDKMVARKLMSKKELQEKREKHGFCASGFCTTSLNADGQKFKCSGCFAKDGPVRIGRLDRLSGSKKYSECPYYEQVFKAINSDKVVMNFSSFIYQTQMTKRFDEPRELMIIDECHNIEPHLLDYVSVTLNDNKLQEYGITIPKFKNYMQYAEWMIEKDLIKTIITIAGNARKEDQDKLADEMERTAKKIHRFLEHTSNHDMEWVHEFESKDYNSRTVKSVTLKPVFINNFVQPLLFQYANKILMMSATILDVDVVCKSLGISRNHVAAYRMKNRFPAKNRPIYLQTVAKMTGGKSKMHEWAPKLLNKTEKICNKYPNSKGIIHTHNFAICDYIIQHASSALKKRLLYQKDFQDKSDLLEHHASTTNSIIIAPAMHEGIDLAGDLSRFQIICKVPFPNCFDDAQLARRVELDERYYNWLVSLKLWQSYGRSIRSPEDFADTYILDESIHNFLKFNKKMVPSYVREAIIK